MSAVGLMHKKSSATSHATIKNAEFFQPSETWKLQVKTSSEYLKVTALTLLHSEWPKLYTTLVLLTAEWVKGYIRKHGSAKPGFYGKSNQIQIYANLSFPTEA